MPINIANSGYQDFFKAKLKDYGVSSPADMNEETRRKFFSEVELEWDKEENSFQNSTAFKDKTGIQTYQAWKKAVKAIDPKASFTGDKDIDSAFVKDWYDADWSGDVGEIRSMVK